MWRGRIAGRRGSEGELPSTDLQRRNYKRSLEVFAIASLCRLLDSRYSFYWHILGPNFPDLHYIELA